MGQCPGVQRQSDSIVAEQVRPKPGRTADIYEQGFFIMVNNPVFLDFRAGIMPAKDSTFAVSQLISNNPGMTIILGNNPIAAIPNRVANNFRGRFDAANADVRPVDFSIANPALCRGIKRDA